MLWSNLSKTCPIAINLKERKKIPIRMQCIPIKTMIRSIAQSEHKQQ